MALKKTSSRFIGVTITVFRTIVWPFSDMVVYAQCEPEDDLNSEKPPRPIGVYLIIAGILQLVWGLVPSASKWVIEEIPVELYIALRWSISSLIFASFLTITRGWRPMARKDFFAVAALGLLGYGMASLGTLYGLKIGGVTNFALMSSLSPVITSAAAIWLLHERPTRLFFVALPLAVIGLIILVVGKYQISSIQIAGASVLLVVAADVLEALVFVGSKKFRTRVSSTQYLAVAQGAAALAMWLGQLFFFRQTDQLGELSPTGWMAAIFVSVVACVLCYAVLYWLLSHVDGHRLALFDGFHTLSATAFGILLFNDHPTWLTGVGGGLILVGLVLGNWPQRRALRK